MSTLKFEGCQTFRYRLVASILSGKSLRIDNIREKDEYPGLQEFEASFLRLLEKLSNGKTKASICRIHHVIM